MPDVSDLFDPADIAAAEKLGLGDWLTELADWHAELGGGEHATASGWYLTDLRHLGNLSDPYKWTPRENPDHRVLDFCDNVVEPFIEDHFGDGEE